jgi:hypothetical protein
MEMLFFTVPTDFQKILFAGFPVFRSFLLVRTRMKAKFNVNWV